MTRRYQKITNNQELNECIIEGLMEILKVSASSRGNQFDETVKERLKMCLPGVSLIPTERWCDKEKSSIFANYYKRTRNNNFNFTDLEPIIDNNKPLNLMLVDKPNGKQKWPDLLIVYNGVGLPIEIKSAQEDKILWNGGLPMAGALYIFNCYGKKNKTTCFLGEDAITEEEREFLIQQAAFAESLNNKHKDNKWSFYVRNMFNSNQSFIESEEIIERSFKKDSRVEELNQIINKLSKVNSVEVELMNDNEIIYDLVSRKQTLEKILKEEADLYNLRKEEREARERAVIEYIRNLTWDNEQISSFDSVKNKDRKLKP